MIKGELTTRKQQALVTKKKIFDAAVSLMKKQGFEETSIEQICKRAKVSIGSFYNYFGSKHDVLSMVYESADLYFKNVVRPELEPLELEEKILRFFSHYARYNMQNGLDFVKHLYGNSDNKLFVDENRFMHQLLHTLLKSAHEENRLLSSIPFEEIEPFLFLMARGIVNEWCLFDGGYDLEEKMVRYFRYVLPLVVR